MKRSRMTVLALVAALALGLAVVAPAGAVAPTNKSYFLGNFAGFGWFFNSPILLVANDCLDFGTNTVCSTVLGDCGPYSITGTDGSVTYFRAELRSRIGPILTGKMVINGAVDRQGAGSSIAATGNGKLGSFGILPTRTNVTLHGQQVPSCAPTRSSIQRLEER